MWHVGSSSLTRDGTPAPCIASTESQPLDHWGSPQHQLMLTSSFDHRAPPLNPTVIEVGKVPLSTILSKHMTTASHLSLKYPKSSLHSQVCGLDFLSFLWSKYRNCFSPKLLLIELLILVWRKIH